MRTLLVFPLLVALTGCFYTLDGSLVDKKRDSGTDVALTDGTPDVTRPDTQAADTAPEEASVTDAAGEGAADLLTEGGTSDAGDAAPVEAGIDAGTSD